MENITPITTAKRRNKKVPAVIKIYVHEATHPIRIHMEDVHDWAIIFDNVLEVKTDETNFYYPIDNLDKWKVEKVDVIERKETESN